MTDIPIEGKVVPIVQGQRVANASDVEVTGENGSTTQAALNNISRSVVNWKFNNTITDGTTNPGAGFIAFNSTAKDATTIVSFNSQSNSDNARFDEMLKNILIGTRLYIQERTATNNSILFRVTGTPTPDAGTKITVPVIRERDQGGEFSADAPLNVMFFPTVLSTTQISALAAAEKIDALDTDFNKDKVLRLAGENVYAAGLADPDQEKLDAVTITRSTSGAINTETMWYTAQAPSQGVIDTFETTPGGASQWIRVETADGIPPVLGSSTTYTVVSRNNVLYTGITAGTGPVGSTFSEITNLTLAGYHIYQVVIPSGDPLDTALTVILEGGLVTYAATGLVPTVKISEENLSSISLPSNTPYDGVARELFGGARIETTEGADRVEYESGYSQGVDYRDNAAGIFNDDTHYVDVAAGVSISSNLASSTIQYATGTTLHRLIAIKLQLNASQTGTGAMIVLLSAVGGTEREFVHVTTDNTIEIDPQPNTPGATHETVQNLGGDVVIDDGTWLILETIPLTAPNWRVVPVLMLSDGTRIEANDIDVDMTGISGEDLGISRSASQRGQITEYKTIQEPGYLNHDQLTNLFDHIDEKWDFGFARLFEAGTTDKVELADNVILQGKFRPTDHYEEVTVSASTFELPDKYQDYLFLYYEFLEDGGQTICRLISTAELAAVGSFGVSNPIRGGGNDHVTWDRATRTIGFADVSGDTWSRAILFIRVIPAQA